MKRRLICALCLVTYALSSAAGPKIYINPGHGGYNSNDRNIVTINHASGDHDGFWESQANLTKGLYLRDMLQAAGATVYMSRTDNRSGYRDDKSISNTIGDRPLSTIAREASQKGEFFLSIHSNAGGNSTDASVNYLLLMLTGTTGSADWSTNYKYSEAKKAADYAMTRMGDHPMTWWSSSSKRMYSYTTYTVISPSYLTIPGYLSEGEFHDYKPETHRLLNDDYCKLEAYRLLQAFCDYYSSSLTRPTTGVICGDVRDNSTQMTNNLYKKASGTKDPYTPLNGAKVRLKDMDDNVLATYICDDEWNGFYAFWDVAPGTYKVQCAAAGHASNTQTVTVTANNITYNNVKLGSGSGDGMEDIVIPPLGVLYDTVINHSAATWLNAETIRRAVVKEDQLYVLTNDNTIHIVNANTGLESATMNTAGISGTQRNIGDIALTEDNILLASTQDRTTTPASDKMKVYKWTADDAAPVKVFESANSGNYSEASVGRSIVVKGTISNFRLFTLAYSLQSVGVRIVQHSWNGSTVSTIRNNNTTGNTLGDSTIWYTAELVASPYNNSQFLINSKTIYPALLSVSQSDGAVFSKNECSNLLLGTSGGTFVTYDNHILYITPYGTDNVGVGIYDATGGLSSATLIKTLYPETELAPASAGYMTSSAQVDGDEMVVTLYVQNRGIDRWRLSQSELETTIVTPPAVPVAGAAIYASELTMSESGDVYTFSYRLNTDATDVTLQLIYEGNVVQTKSFGAQAAGVRSGTLNASEITFSNYNTDDYLTWAIQATATPTNVISKLSDDATKYQFYSPFGVAVDMHPESAYFGRVYVTNARNGTCSAGRTTANGLYAFDAGLNALNNSAYTGGVTWLAQNSPFRLAVAEDGRVFLCDWADAHSGIWIAPAGGITGSFTELFPGLSRNSDGLATNGSSVPVHGSVSGCWVEGKGADTKLYTMDEDYEVDGQVYNMLRYDIGNASTWTTAPSAVEFANKANSKPLVNNVLNVVSDLHGGWWIIQHRFAETSLEPSMIHVRNGAIDYNTGGEQLLENSKNGGLAVNYDGSRIATTSQSQINVWDVTYHPDGSFESISPVAEITASDISGLDTSSNDVAFDPAGNLYYVSNTSERLVVIGLPKAENHFVTPARSEYTIPLPAASSVLVTEWEQSGLTIDFQTTPTATGVVAMIGATQTETLPLENVYAHIATGTTAASYVKHITLSGIKLSEHAGETLTLKWKAAGAVIGRSAVTIPTLIASDIIGLPSISTGDVVVLPGATWTPTAPLDLISMEIYPGAKVVVTDIGIEVNTLILRLGWTTAHTAFQVPKLALVGTAALTATNAYLDCVIDYAQYYPLAVPYTVTRSAITYRDYPSAPAASGVLFRQYDGAQRAAGNLGSNWQSITPTTLTPTHGYAVTAKRMPGTQYSTIRMPMDMNSTRNTVTVTAYGVGTGLWNNVGWNFIASPYTMTLNGSDEASFTGALTIQGDGSGLRYVTIPTQDFQDYSQLRVDEAALEPMSPFFVQAGTTGDVTFLATNQNPTLAPRRSPANVLPTIDIRLRLSSDDDSDMTYLLIGDEFTTAPDYNADLPKMFGPTLKVYSLYSGDSLASLALPTELTGELIPLGIQTSIAGNFTLSLAATSATQGLDRLELIDGQEVVADLMQTDYTTALPVGTTHNRFSLRPVRPNTTPSEIENTTSSSIDDTRKYIINQHVVIERNGEKFDVLGRSIMQ